jgi:hypothetical protein
MGHTHGTRKVTPETELNMVLCEPPFQPKVAQVGTRMLRRSDVFGRLQRHRMLYLDNMRKAEAQGNEDWRTQQLAKLRVLEALANDIIDRCPAFVNAQAVEAS